MEEIEGREAEGKTNQELDWNISGGLSQEIAAALERAGQYYLKANYNAAYRNLKAVKLRFIQNLSTEQKKLLNTIEKILEKHLWLGRLKLDKFSIKYKAEKEKQNFSKRRVVEYYDRYNMWIMVMLDGAGFLMRKKSDSVDVN